MSFDQSPSNKTIDIIDVIRNTFIFMWKNKDSFINLCLPAVVILSIVSTILSEIYPEASKLRLSNSNNQILITQEIIIPIIISIPLVTFFIICFSTGWHRYYLIPNDKCSLKDSLLWKKRHTKYLYSTITIFLIIILLAMFSLVFSFLGPIGILFTLIMILVFYSRFSFVLPLAAIDHQFNFSDSWQMTKGNTIKISSIIFFIWLFTILFSIFFGQIVQSIFNYPLSFMGVFVISFLFRFLSFISIGLIVTALSIIYTNLNGNSGNSINFKV